MAPPDARSWPRIAAALAVALAVVCAVADACAATGGGRLVVSLPDGSAGPLVLAPGQGGWVGLFTLTNLGPEPLTVSRLAIRGGDDDVRSPSRVTVRFVDGATASATLAPGAARDALVAWMPDKNPRVRQAFGHVIVTSSDEEAGEVAMGFRARLPTGLGWVGDHALSLMVLLPLLLPPLLWLTALAGRRDGPFASRAALAVEGARLLLALWVYHRFAPGVGRVDGNDGLQLVERSVWVRSAGSEWYLGVDGTSIALVVLAAALGVLAALVAGAERADGARHAGLALFSSALMGALLALDLVVLFVSWSLVVVALALLVGAHGGRRSAQAAAKLGVYGAIGAGALLVASIALSGASEASYLVDGTPVAHTMSVPELYRTSFAAKPPIAGVPFLEAIWVLLLVVVVAATAAVPLHGWLPDALEHGPASAGILAAGAAVALGPYLLVRVGLGAVPEGARWLGPTIATLGAISCAWGALCALAQRGLRRFVAYATVASAGACLYGVASLTAQGIAGALAASFAHGLGAAMLLAIAGGFEERARTSDLGRLGGLSGDAPGLHAIFGVALAVSGAVPGLVGGWGALLALLGGFEPHPVLGVLLGAGLLVSVVAHGRVARIVLFGQPDPSWRGSPLLQAFGGRLPDATARDVIGLVPLAALALLLGLWPAPLLSAISGAARDASEAVRVE
jgi:NADH-quinone oxidoreductase subunit M